VAAVLSDVTASLFHVLCAVLLLGISSVAAADEGWRGQAHSWLGPGFDSNAQRDVLLLGDRSQPDGFLFALLSLDGAFQKGRFDAFAAYDGAGRLFLTLPSENSLIQSTQGELSVSFRLFRLAALGRVRDRRGAERDYSALSGEGALDIFASEALSFRLKGGAERFLFRPRFSYSFFGPTASLSAKYQFDKRHSLSLGGQYSARTFNGRTNDNPQTPDDEATRIRKDSVASGFATYSYRGRVQWSLGYSFLLQASNSFGEGFRRHRVNASLGLRLPWQLFFLASGVVQLTQFPDGIFLSPDLQVIEDDENSSFVTLKLLRPLTSFMDVDLRYAFYLNFFPRGGEYVYLRHVVTLGLSFTF
jgi:hypothetical protein